MGVEVEQELDREAVAAIADEVAGWLSDGYIDGVVQRFKREYRRYDRDVEDAVSAAVEKLIKRAGRGPVGDPKGYFYVIVRNGLNDAARRLVHSELPEDDLLGGNSDEYHIFAKELIGLVRKKVDGWPNKQMAIVTIAYIEAAYYDEPLAPEDVQQIVADTLGDEISRTNVSTLWNRGRTRLAEQLHGLI